jgi:hypothetical protein
MSRPATFDEYKAAEAASGLGGIRRECHECHAPWDMRNGGCSNCGSLLFDEKVIEPVALEFGPLGVIRKAVGLEKPKVLPLSAEDSATLKRAADAGRAFVLTLMAAETVAQKAVNTELGTRETVGYLRSKLVDAAATLGDFSIENLKPIAPAILGLSDLIETTLARLEEETKQ